MSTNKTIHALYNDDDILMDAVKKVKDKHHHIEEVFCPFPVHGLDTAMGLAPTRLAITAFFYGLTGLGVAIWLTWYTMIVTKECKIISFLVYPFFCYRMTLFC